jgi:hypothetical protein
MKCFAITVFAAGLLSPALAQSPSPYQDQKVREGVVARMADQCIQSSKAKYGLPGDQFQQGCLCFAHTLVDSINSEEYDALLLGKVPESLDRKRAQALANCSQQAR